MFLNYMKEESKKALEIIKNYKSSPNKDLIFILEKLQDDFDQTKNAIIKLTHHLDKVEITYNSILTEYKKRTNTE
jgi:hypothetical protein|tara:strand:+ start:2280 stop:2504 length:225 start_codon:yes stop_codon:yes gene_type:complete